MKKRHWAALVLGATLVGGYLAVPSVVRWQVQKRVPGVTVRDASVGWGRLTLTGVEIDRGWVRGSVEKVTIDWTGKTVRVEGGDLSVNLDEKPKGSGEASGHRTIEASGLTVRVQKGPHRIQLTGARTQGDSQVCFETAALEDPAVTLERGCVERDGSRVEAQQATTTPMEYRGVQLGPVTALGVRYDARQKTASVQQVTTELVVEGHVVPVEANDIAAQHGERDVLTVGSLRTQEGWLATDWTEIENLTVRHDQTWEVSVGSSQIHVDRENLAFTGSETCETWIRSLPKGLVTPPLDTLQMSGETSFRVQLRPNPSITLKSDCRAVCGTLPDLRKPFRYTAYDSKGVPFERTTGPGTKGWLPIGLTGEVPTAVIGMEDPGFPRHKGFISKAFENSLADNLRKRRFFRGGSTITMQLAKNLWLTREKTLGRKAQEFFLAQALESCYQKDEILELYLNVVEFGPDQYGVGAGSEHWFQKGPMELSGVEAFWLASVLPRPNRVGPPTEASLGRIEKLMKRLATDGRIPETYSGPDSSDLDMNGWEANP